MAVIDAHQHIWDLNRAEYSWLTPALAPLDRDFTFDELRPALVRVGVDATVLVQAADNDNDTDLMLEVAHSTPEIVAVVGWVPLDAPARAAARLAELRQDPYIVGVRQLIHDMPDPDWILRPEVHEGLGLLEESDMAFDYVGILPRHLENLLIVSERHPALRIVLDHLGRPPVGSEDREPWWSLIAQVARNPRIHAKASGLYSVQGDPADWTVEAVRPYFDRAMEVFGVDRLIFGGDWPISILAGGYERMWEGLNGLLSGLEAAERDQVLGLNAARTYRIAPDLLSQAVPIRN